MKIENIEQIPIAVDCPNEHQVIQSKLRSEEAFRQSEFAKTRQCYRCRAMLGLLSLCPHCGANM